MKKALAVVAGMALVVSGFGLTAYADPHGTTCALDGKATFKPGLTVVPATYGYKFKGKLTECLSSGDITSGKVAAKGSGTVACEGGTTSGTAIVKWNTGKVTKVSFSTTDVGASVTISGTVTKSTEPAFIKGDHILGEVIFEADASQCTTGLKSATFSGQVGGGSPT